MVSGSVEALGGNNNCACNGGSGGAIRLLAPKVEGTGMINVGSAGNGGLGRTRVDTIDRSNLRFPFKNSVTTVGATMFVSPKVVPQLDVIEVASNPIPIGSNPVSFTLPFGSATDRTVVVRAKDFGVKVPIAVVLTPDSGDRVIVQDEVDNTPQNPSTSQGVTTKSVKITLRPNVPTTIHVWTR